MGVYIFALGYQVLSAEDGNDALQLMQENPDIDLLFNDVLMPGGINGYELAEMVTERKPAIKILLTSGNKDRVLCRKEQEVFKDSLISKPYKLHELAQGIRVALDNHQIMDTKS